MHITCILGYACKMHTGYSVLISSMHFTCISQNACNMHIGIWMLHTYSKFHIPVCILHACCSGSFDKASSNMHEICMSASSIRVDGTFAKCPRNSNSIKISIWMCTARRESNRCVAVCCSVLQWLSRIIQDYSSDESKGDDNMYRHDNYDSPTLHYRDDTYSDATL